MRVLVCGGRNFKEVDWFYEEMDYLHSIYKFTTLISGHASGADQLGEMWADETDREGIEVLIFPADWKTHGDKAGYLRNKQMLDEGKPDLVVAFPGGKGTKMMIELAQKAGVSFLELGKE